MADAEVVSRVWPGVDTVAVSNMEGAFEARVEWPEHHRDTYYSCTVRAPGCALWTYSGKLVPEQELDLGTVRLAPGGSVSGCVALGTTPAARALLLVVPARALPTEPGRRFDACPSTGPAWRSAHGPQPEYEKPLARGVSAEDGSFRILGVPPGLYGIWAHCGESYWATTEAFEVRAGEETALPELELEPLPQQHRIAGIVLDPDNAPVPGASVEASAVKRREDCFTKKATSGPDGCFELFVLPLSCGPMKVEAEVADGRFSAASASPVAPGTNVLVLRLGRMQELLVRVVAPDGLPVESFGWRLDLQAGSSLTMSGSAPETRPDGRATIRFPEGTLRRLSIEAPGFKEQRVEVGPGDGEVLVSLKGALPVISGIVGSRGAPIPAAHVDLVLQDRDLVDDLIGRPERWLFYCTPGNCAASDAEGRFRIPNGWPKYSYRVRAWAEGFAPAYSGEVQGAATGLELELSEGGTLAGEVRLAAGSSAGIAVRAHRADTLESSNCQVGRQFRTRVEDDGTYRFEHLEPGPWLVVPELSPGELQALGWSAKEGETVRATPFVFTVSEGRETVALLDLREPGGRCRLRGTLTVGDRIAGGYVYLILQGEQPLRIASSGVESRGRFELTTHAPGTYRLVVNAGPGHDLYRLVTDVVTLVPGEQTWERSLTVEAWKEEGVRLDHE